MRHTPDTFCTSFFPFMVVVCHLKTGSFVYAKTTMTTHFTYRRSLICDIIFTWSGLNLTSDLSTN